MHDNLKISGWALNSECFCTIMNMLRDDVSYRAIVDELIEVPEKADTQDTETVKRIATTYLKLLFPHVRKAADVHLGKFRTYCLNPAVKMRGIIKIQLGIIDSEYGGKSVPEFSINILE
jgi:ATP-dependent Lon protease